MVSVMMNIFVNLLVLVYRFSSGISLSSGM